MAKAEPRVEPAPVKNEPQPLAPQPATVEVAASAVSALTVNKATALQLMQKGNSHVSARSQNKVLQIASGRSAVSEVPQSWRISYYDEKASAKTVEVRFEAGEMERVFEPGAFLGLFSFGSSKTLDLEQVRIDSDQAIHIAAAQCEGEEVTPRFVELKLERGYGGLPVWNVKLFGTAPGKTSDDAALGSVILLAEDGKVLKKDIVSKSEKSAVQK
jgi:hypothetical protein